MKTLDLKTNTYQKCKGRKCECTDGINHSKECLQEHEDAINGVIGLCSVPMWCQGHPAGTCGQKAYGERPYSREYYSYAQSEFVREDGRYNGYVPGLACPKHGGPKPKIL